MKVPQQFYKPMSPEQKSRRQQFEDLNTFITARHGWIVSPPSDATLRIECLLDSMLPDDLRRAGYDLTEAGEGQPILPRAMVERFVIGADGERKPVTTGSTRPVQTVSHASIVAVKRYSLALADQDGLQRTIRWAASPSVCFQPDSVAKVLRRHATNFPLNDETSANRRSICPQADYGSHGWVDRLLITPST
jgi:hypothetical protein